MTFTDLFPLIEIMEQVVSGAQRLAAIKEKAPFKNMQRKSEGCFIFLETRVSSTGALIQGSTYTN